MYKIAIASSNGESVNQHFGQAENFLIYEMDDNGEIEFIDDRNVKTRHVPSLQQRSDNPHIEAHLQRIIETISDCKAVFVLHIGQQSSRVIRAQGITPFEVDFPLHKIFETLRKQQQRGRVRLF